jgi:hypothetical protein
MRVQFSLESQRNYMDYLKEIDSLFIKISKLHNDLLIISKKYGYSFDTSLYSKEDADIFFDVEKKLYLLKSKQRSFVPKEALDKLLDQFPDVNIEYYSFSINFWKDICVMVPSLKNSMERFPLQVWSPDDLKWGPLPIGC